MKRSICLGLMVTGIVVLLMSQSAFANQNEKINELLGKIETRLAALEVTQGKGGEALHQLSKMSPGELPPALVASIDELEKQMANLTSELDGVKADDHATTNAVGALACELRELLGLIRGACGGQSACGGCSGESTCGGEAADDGLVVSGFVDASYFYNGPKAEGTFGFDQGEVDFEKTIGERGSVRLDIEWVSDGEDGYTMDAEQGYVAFNPQALGPMSIQFGKFNAPIGFECLDPPDMYQYSHALVFDNGLPTNVTGAMLTAASDSGFDIALYVCNGWDQNNDNNEDKTIGARLGLSPCETFSFGVSTIIGAQTEAEGKDLTVFDVDATATPLAGLTLGSEFNYGRDETGEDTTEWMGGLVMGHYDFSDTWGLTVRYDYFDDKDALRLGSGDCEIRQSIAFAPTFCLGDGMGALFEFRTDSSDKEVFLDKDGEATKSASFYAFEMTYTF